MEHKVLTPDEVDAALRQLRDWSVEDGALVRRGTAPSFMQAIAWVVEMADVAEAMQHHPDLEIRWRTITVRLSTHDVGGITGLDLDLAAKIDAVLD